MMKNNLLGQDKTVQGKVHVKMKGRTAKRLNR